MTDFQVTQLVVALGTLLTGLAAAGAIFVALYRESRNRKWEKEDRERLAQDLVNKTQASADLVRSELVQAQRIAVHNTDEITKQIGANTQLTAEAKDAANLAYKEANHVNLKIAELRLDLVAIAEKVKIPINSLSTIKSPEDTTEKKEEESQTETTPLTGTFSVKTA